MTKKADFFIFHRVFETGFCEYVTDTTVFIDGNAQKFEQNYTNVTASSAVNYSLAEAVEYGQGICGDESSCIIDSNGSPYVDLTTFNGTLFEEELIYG